MHVWVVADSARKFASLPSDFRTKSVTKMTSALVTNAKPPESVRRRSSGPLTDLFCRRVSGTEKIALHHDGNGLYFLVHPTGRKTWKLHFEVRGVPIRCKLGSYPDCGLADARELAASYRRDLANGIDPRNRMHGGSLLPASGHQVLFEQIAREWRDWWAVGKSAQHVVVTWRRIEFDVLPRIGPVPILGLTAPEIVRCVREIHARGAVDLAKRALGYIKMILAWAVANGKLLVSPAEAIRLSLILPQRRQVNRARLAAAELPEFLAKADAYRG